MIDRLLTVAFSGARAVEPSDAEVRRVLARVAAHPRRRVRRVVALSLAFVLLAVSAGFAVPQSRERLLDGFGKLSDFFSGGDPPGAPVPADDPSGVLNWWEFAAPEGRSVLVRFGGERLVTFRRRAAEGEIGQACIGLGAHAAECGDPAHWAQRFETNVLGTLLTTQTKKKGVIALWGVAAEAVTTVSIRYADGGRATGKTENGGYIVAAEGARQPRVLIGRDAEGAVLAEIDVSDLQWCFSSSPTGKGCE